MLKLLKIIEIKENFSPKNGNKKMLYGITNIKKTTQNGKLDNSSVISNKSSFYSDNITQSNDNVKLPSTKYSMQIQNNTQNTNQPTNSLYKDAEIEQKVKSIVTSPAMRRQMYQDIDNYIEDY